MYDTLTVTMRGVSPLLMHNGQLADPLNRFAKALKRVSGQRKKTDADFEEMARIEFIGGLHMDEAGPVIPATAIAACIVEGARKSKLGKAALAGVLIERGARLDYEGPRDAAGLFADERFRLTAGVKVGQARVMRTRPIFPGWSAEASISYIPQVINKRDLLDAFKAAGMLIGIGDWRPRHGRFTVDEMQRATAA